MICQDKELSVFDEVLSNAYNELRNLSTDIELLSKVVFSQLNQAAT
ncbi:MAG: hypothetical protein GY814_06035 [Gammaproteobacteria bacterium]|nr:hypothetical protein [Gammaproteobacteria bacterium]